MPFRQYQAGTVIVAIVVRDERPPTQPRESLKGDSYEEIWRIAELCWTKIVEDRPTMNMIVLKWPCSMNTEDKG